MNAIRSAFSALVLLLLIVLCAGLLVGLPFYTMTRGVTVPATVTRKEETITLGYGDWSRRFDIGVSYQPRDTLNPEQAGIHVDAATFDQLHVGSTVHVKYPPNRSLRDLTLRTTTQLANRSPFLWLIDLLTVATLRAIAIILGGIGVFAFWRRWHVRGGGLVFLAYVVGAAFYLFVLPSTPAVPGGQRATTTATVSGLHRYNTILEGPRSSGVDALQPYSIVELTFVPAGRTDPVVAVATIDAGSVPGLRQGSSTAITYAVSDPRTAQMVGARHSYYWKNVLGVGLALAGLLLLIVIAGVVGELLQRGFRRLVG